MDIRISEKFCIIIDLLCLCDRLFIHVFANYCKLLMEAVCNISTGPVDIVNMAHGHHAHQTDLWSYWST